MPGESAQDFGVSAEDEVRRVMNTLQQKITSRFIRLKDLNSKFGFGFLLDVTRLLEHTDTELSHKCVDLAQFSDTDIAASELNSGDSGLQDAPHHTQ